MGHTPHFDGFVRRCEDKILLIDTGISRAYGGEQSALVFDTMTKRVESGKWKEEKVLTALYKGRKARILKKFERELTVEEWLWYSFLYSSRPTVNVLVRLVWNVSGRRKGWGGRVDARSSHIRLALRHQLLSVTPNLPEQLFSETHFHSPLIPSRFIRFHSSSSVRLLASLPWSPWSCHWCLNSISDTSILPTQKHRAAREI